MATHRLLVGDIVNGIPVHRTPEVGDTILLPDGSTVASFNGFKVFRHAGITSGDIADKYIDMPETPANIDNVEVSMAGFATLEAEVSYSIDASGRISWDNKELEGVIALGDKIVVKYS